VLTDKERKPVIMQEDVDQLIRAAEKLTGMCPSQPPPPVPEVGLVARHGKPVAPLLLALLSDDASDDEARRGSQFRQTAPEGQVEPSARLLGDFH
jgi:hypothetical protein